MPTIAMNGIMLLINLQGKQRSIVITSDDSSCIKEFKYEFLSRWDSGPVAIYNFDDLISDGNVAFPNGFVMNDFLKSSK